MDVAADHPRQLARIEPTGMAAPSAEEPPQALGPHRAANVCNRADMMSHHENIMGTSTRGRVQV
jgi:hypothetical protein